MSRGKKPLPRREQILKGTNIQHPKYDSKGMWCPFWSQIYFLIDTEQTISRWWEFRYILEDSDVGNVGE